jgi:hypothetical protein
MALNSTYYLYNALNKKNKYTIQYINDKTGRINTINFGAKSYDDYLTSNDDEKKRLYRARHVKDYINDFTSGAFSWHLLWNKKTLQKSIKNMEDTFNIKIINHSTSY